MDTLAYKKYGSGPPLIILHGLFGSKDNWASIATQLSETFEVWCLDLRNHGESFHDAVHTYDAMGHDIITFIQDNNLHTTPLVGHSMGGKAAMAAATIDPTLISKLIVVDIAPRQYADHHSHILEGLNAIDLTSLHARSEADTQLATFLSDMPTRQFLLKNLRRDATGFSWQINLPAITHQYAEISGFIPSPATPIKIPTLVIKGELSNYISFNDESLFRQYFSTIQIQEISGAGHWVHAQKPNEVVEAIHRFLKN